MARAPAPPPSPTTQPSPPTLCPGDVLLSCGREALSQLICKVDGGMYSHAALWDGHKVVEATARGVVRRVISPAEGSRRTEKAE